jgi:hypothetical protein
MLNSEEKIHTLRNKKNKYSNSRVVRKKKILNEKKPLQVKWSVPYDTEFLLYIIYLLVKHVISVFRSLGLYC